MKTFENKIIEIKNLIKLSEQDRELFKFDKKEVAKHSKNIKYYTDLLRYLETNPSVEYVEYEKVKLSSIIKSKDSQFKGWFANGDGENVPLEFQKPEMEKKAKSYFLKMHAIAPLKKKLKTVQFLLK